MSSICVGILEINNTKTKEIFVDSLTQFVEKHGWGIVFNSDASIIIENINNYNGKITFDLSDFPKYPNCERLLNADWCTFNGEDNKYPLKERLEFITEVIELCLESADRMEMFISDGDFIDIEDFELYEIEPSQFVDILISLYKKIGFAPNAHFKFIKN